MGNNQAAFRAIVSGRVQLVMYRDFTHRKAKSAAIVGAVKNLSDGTVEVIAEGDKSKLEKFIAFLQKGPLLAQVEGVAVEWREPTGTFKGFSIEYS